MTFRLVEILQRDTPHGWLGAFALPEATAENLQPLLASLHPDELARTKKFAARRQMTFAGGRWAIREALKKMGVHFPLAIASNSRGAPGVPQNLRLSLAHKDDVVCVLVQRGEQFELGVDVEHADAVGEDIESKIMTDKEQKRLRTRPATEHVRERSICFAVKEALYKALDPYVQRYVDFREVEVTTSPSGVATVDFFLKGNEGPFLAEAHWYCDGAFVFATCKVKPIS